MGGGATVGDVENSEILRDEGEETGTGSFDRFVEFVLPPREWLSYRTGSVMSSSGRRNERRTLQTAFLENLKI